MLFCANTMGKINLDSLNEIMAKQAVRPKKPTVGSSSTLKTIIPDITFMVEALPLQFIAP